MVLSTEIEQNRKWRAESDARTLADAFDISNDKERLSAAQVVAKEMAIKAQLEAEKLSSISSNGKARKNTNSINIGKFKIVKKGK